MSTRRKVESQLQGDWYLLVRDIYAFYPLLIKYVDLQRNHWLRHNVPESEELYGYVAEIFNMWSKSTVRLTLIGKFRHQ
jgi:ryanodine receptor 2